MAEADSIVLVMDGQTGLTGSDEEIVSWLRKTYPRKPVLLAINKCESPTMADTQVCPDPYCSALSKLPIAQLYLIMADFLHGTCNILQGDDAKYSIMSFVQVAEFWKLGLEPIAVSAISGTGTGDLMDQLISTLPHPKQPSSNEEPPSDAPLAVAIIGRPNVGKSSLLNSLVRPCHPKM